MGKTVCAPVPLVVAALLLAVAEPASAGRSRLSRPATTRRFCGHLWGSLLSRRADSAV